MDERFGIGVRYNHLPVCRLEKLFGHRMVEKPQEVIVVPLNVKNPAGLSLQAKLRPCQHFAKLLEGAVSARQSDECIR